ncbi:MAG: hypothetical protein RBS08_05365 [Bdellovibrionales bacterium]|jgi:hypothetical protein|nr:hypothetical protein [Bdellovibrionales bacterium]
MKRPSLIAALFCLFLAGCSGSSALRNAERMQGFIGQSEENVIKAFGVPDKTYTLESGTKIISYDESYERYDPPTSTVCVGSFPGRYGMGSCMGGPSRRVNLSCERSFHMRKGKVVDWSQHGNNCPGGSYP